MKTCDRLSNINKIYNVCAHWPHLYKTISTDQNDSSGRWDYS